MVNNDRKDPDQPSGYFISAPWRSSGKTLVSMGLAAAATDRGLVAQTFKKGPDYIDARWLGTASANPCYNLDFRQQSTQEITQLYQAQTAHCDVTLVEGTMGLHDGVKLDGSDSNASMAKLLNLPVLLVMDCRGMHRTVAALINGILQFDPDLNFAGVILNRVRTDRHAQKIQRAISQYTDLDILGVIPESRGLAINEQELGLTPAPECEAAEAKVRVCCDRVQTHCNLDALFQEKSEYKFCESTHVEPLREHLAPLAPSTCLTHGLKIGIARDEAFHFYYQDDLDYLESNGIELIEISPLVDTFPTNLDGMIIGGGFPERYAHKLSSNQSFLSALRKAVHLGMPVHAECGGFMYLCRTLVVNDEPWQMAGIFNAQVCMKSKPVGRGYMELCHGDGNGETFWAHEFHHSEITFDTPPEFVYRVKRGHGVDGYNDGVCHFNTIASYAHFRHTAQTPWIDRFLNRVVNHSKVLSICSK